MLGAVLRKLLQWIVAFIIAILLMNTFMLFYYRPAGWIPRTNSATNAIWNPGARLYASLEGRGVYKVDKNGYLNTDKKLGGGILSP